MSSPPWYRSPRPAWRTGRRRAALVLGLALSIGLLPQYSPQALAADGGLTKPGTQTNLDDPVRGKNAKPEKFRQSDEAAKAAVEDAEKTTWPKAATAEVALTSDKTTRAEGLPLTARATGGKNAADSLRVEVLGRKATTAAGVDGVLFTVARADGEDSRGTAQVALDYSAFADAYGGGYGSRLRLAQYPECVLTTPEKKSCSTPTYLKSTNDAAKQTLTAKVTAAGDTAGTGTQLMRDATASTSSATVLAATAGAEGDGGDYKATSLKASSEWGVDTSSGAFTWSYPLTTPPVPGGSQPKVGLSYNSQSVDGQTAATNNQGSWIGQGFTYEPGFIERSYKACADDGHEDKYGDQCWAYDNATLSLAGGTSGEIVKDDTTGQWRVSGDDNSKVEKLTDAVNGDNNGEHWKVTTTDGTQYFFGLGRLPGHSSGKEETASTWTVPVYGDDSGEPCYDATFANAHCTQAWRWNLDHVIDPHGNVMSYYYGKETNHYTQGLKTGENGKAYVRGGYLKRIDYGQRAGKVYSTEPSARVVFTTAERCIGDLTDCEPGDLTDATAADWPDVPWDQNCKADTKCAGQNSPTFWTRKKLTKITTQIRTGDSTYSAVDEWALSHDFTDNGDGSKSLWLKAIDHTGKVGTDVPMPSVELYGQQLASRVDVAGDNIQPFHRFRLSAVKNETGGVLSVNYADTQCTSSTLPAEDSSTKRCFPVKWSPPGAEKPIVDWFHKYVVASVVEQDLTGGNAEKVTSYTYLGDAGWRKVRPDGITTAEYRTWGDWRGYGRVRVETSDGTNSASNTKSEHIFFRGLDGDVDADGDSRSATVKDSAGTSYEDSDWKAGQELETITYNGSDITQRAVTLPWTHVTATRVEDWGTRRARYLDKGSVDTYVSLGSGNWRHLRSTTSYDDKTGRAVRVDDAGEVGVADNECTRTEYADNASLHLYSYVSRVEKVGVDCSTTPNRKTDVISDELTLYDGSTTLGAAPTKGDATMTKKLSAHDGTTATYRTTAVTTYDDYGRPRTAMDAESRTTKTDYVDAHGLATKSTVTNPLGWTTSTEYAPQRGVPTAKVDQNGKRTELAYDGLGRLTSVWLPDRIGLSPSIKYTYLVRGDDGPTAVQTRKIENDGISYGSEWTLYDGLLRPRQEQTEGADGGRMIADTLHDGSGRVVKVNDTYYASGAPTSTLFEPVNADLDAQTVTQYDGAGRATASIFKVAGSEKYRTSYTYGGDRVTTIPPSGGTRTTVVKDARDRTTSLIQYPAGGEAVTTTYGYTDAGLLSKVTDQSGNVWTYFYDQLGRKVRAVDPDTGTSTFAHDAMDRQISVTDNRGNKTSTKYDELGREISTWQGDVDSGTRLSLTRYDTVAKGELYGTYTYKDGAVYSSVTYPTLDPENDYKPVSTKYFVSKTAEPELGGTYEFTTQYNDDGTVQGQGLPAVGDLAAEALSYVHDELQRPTGLNTSLTGGSYVTDVTYSPTSQLEQLELSTGNASAPKTWLTNTFEPGTDRLTRSRVHVEGAAGVAYDADYTYDAAGNVLSLAETPSGGTNDVQCFTYDGLRRLTDMWTSSVTPNGASGTGGTDAACSSGASASTVGGVAPYWIEYGYDAAGNRTSEVRHGVNGKGTSTRTYTYGDGSGPDGADSGPHTVSSVVEKTEATATTPAVTAEDRYTYDAAGNTRTRVLSGDTQTLDWNKQGELTKVTNADGEVTSYKYDAAGERILRDTPDEKTLYLPGTELHLDKSTAKVTATRYYAFAGTTVAMREAAGVHFLLSNHQGTAELAVEASTGQTTRRRTDPFGITRDESTSTSAGWVNDKGFVGGTIQESTGLITLGAREYDADTGRFVSADPVIDYSDPQQINGYAYANNSPVTYSDASGLRLAECVGGWQECGPWPTGHKRGAVAANADGSGGVAPAGNAHTAAQAKADHARAEEEAAKQRAIAIAKELGKIIADELGITDALDCFTTGSLGSCGATVANVVTSLIGGGPVGRLVSKYWYRVDKAYALGKRIVGLGKKLWGSFKGWRKNKKAAEEAQEAADEVGATCKINSFTAETRVLMADGSTKRIDDVDIGDEVVATDPESGVSRIETVAAEIKGTGLKHLVRLTLETDGEKGGRTATVTATAGHPFWIEELGLWSDATDLKAGQWLTNGEGDRVRVAAVERWDQRTTVHNITVTNIHTYYVAGAVGDVLVHNARPKRQRPHPDAEGPHTTFMRDGSSGAIKKYATWVEQTNPRDPAPWSLQKRFDRFGPEHKNADGTVVPTPHINEADGSARPLDDWEKPDGCP
ncbi:RHS repeat-associated core domain-containing protein [Streptomyces sp. AC495_CC817]|uniref:RHS repeat-associated core domain-containing protein n=1 Tax=Streptomyces sp. AC495_CC817 TaxID=2823900 RepID=UPI001C2637F2|nr:RHS repeat-associated core domain-containing protein [Streptomyces sp. AC495_CC817]